MPLTGPPGSGTGSGYTRLRRNPPPPPHTQGPACFLPGAPLHRVLPVSAERALLSRQILNNTASQSVREDSCELMFGQDWDEQVCADVGGTAVGAQRGQ